MSDVGGSAHFLMNVSVEEKDGYIEASATARRWSFYDDAKPLFESGPQHSRSKSRAISYALAELARKFDEAKDI